MSQGRRGPYMRIPTHNIIFAVFCPRSPVIPRFPPLSPPPTGPGAEIELPVATYAVPHIPSFPHVHEFLYTRDTLKFLATLIPQAVWPGRDATTEIRKSQVLVQQLLQTCTISGLLDKLTYVLGTWRNMVHFGIQIEEMWQILQVSYSHIREAIVSHMNIRTAHLNYVQIAARAAPANRADDKAPADGADGKTRVDRAEDDTVGADRADVDSAAKGEDGGAAVTPA